MTQMIMIKNDFICENHSNQRHQRSEFISYLFLMGIHHILYAEAGI